MRDKARRDGACGSQMTRPQRIALWRGGDASATADASRSQGASKPPAANTRRTVKIKVRIKNS